MADAILPRALPQPLKIDPAALADLPEGAVVYSKSKAAPHAVGVMILAKGRWAADGRTQTVPQSDLSDDSNLDVIEELRDTVDFWVLPLP
ncbi:hypothetical protein AB0K08_13650 [Citricoccus sp. NPDC055426]|uniref:hypothetical protein n=1 Tax=Citricoccus sp. NPDC055426 TaxID=3155536 RepID=UPI0034136987